LFFANPQNEDNKQAHQTTNPTKSPVKQGLWFEGLIKLGDIFLDFQLHFGKLFRRIMGGIFRVLGFEISSAAVIFGVC
jgi:hypothetical protein